MITTWAEKIATLPAGSTLEDVLALARTHTMTPEEIQAQCESWVRGMTTGCEHGVLDFEQCPDCHEERAKRNG